jgi:hypothetical protein
LPHKNKLLDLRQQRGKPEASISSEIEMVLEMDNAFRASYHGGDFKGVSCQRIVGNSDEIVNKIQNILLMKKYETCDNAINLEKMEQLQHTLGLLDAAFFYLYR